MDFIKKMITDKIILRKNLFSLINTVFYNFSIGLKTEYAFLKSSKDFIN